MTQSDALWHSMDAANHRETNLLQPMTATSHSKARFPIDLPLNYRAGARKRLCGTGRVVNISSTDVMVTCAHRLKPGMSVKLVIEWPARLDGKLPIHLVMAGKVVFTDASGFAVGSCQHRFRLAERAPETQPEALMHAAADETPQRPESDSYMSYDRQLRLPPVNESPSVHSL